MMHLPLAAIEAASESLPIFSIIVQTLLVGGAVFGVAMAVLSHVRFRSIVEEAREELKTGGSVSAFSLAITDRIGFLGRHVQPFGVIVMENRSEELDDESADELFGYLQEIVQKQLRGRDHLILLADRRIGLIMETERKRLWKICERIREGAGREHVKLSSGKSVAVDLRVGMSSYPETGEQAGAIVVRLMETLEQTTEESPILGALSGEDGEVTEHPPKETEDVEDATVAEGQQHLLDPLTGVLSPARVGPAIQKFIARYRREEDPVSLLVVDIDSLEQYNDHYGESSGDAILKHVANMLMQSCRESDLIGRLGDDEFVILMGCPPENAALAARRMTTSIKKMSLEHGGNRLRYTVGIGVAGYPDHGGNPVRLYDRAIMALEEAKRRGRSSSMMYHYSLERRAVREAEPVDSL